MKVFLFSFTFLLGTLFASAQSQTSFSQGDIHGFWENKGLYVLKIEEHTATLNELISKNYPQKLRHNVFYNTINHLGGNKWTANRFQWKFTDGNPNNGRWVNEGETTLTMSSDKKSFTEGNRTFVRK